nr:hypothetical protein [Tanacetum cinerariifolium]
MVNGKRAYELKGKFLDDLSDNAFSGTNKEDAMEHIEYFLKIVDPTNLSNVNYERLGISVNPISLKTQANGLMNLKELLMRIFFDAEEGNNDEQETDEIFRTETNLFDYETPLCIKFKEFHFLLKVDPELFTHDIKRTKTYEDYENELNDELQEPWSEMEYHMKFMIRFANLFVSKMGKLNGPLAIKMKTDFIPEESY